MKINVIDYTNMEQEVKVGDEVKVEGYKGIVKEINEEKGCLLIEFEERNKKREIWDKNYVCLTKRKKDKK